MRKYDLYVTSANGSYAEETSFDVEPNSCLEPVAEDADEDACTTVTTAKEHDRRKRSRLGKIFDRLRHRNSLAKDHSLSRVSSTRVETGSVATVVSLPDARSRDTRDDDTTVAIDNTTTNGNFHPSPATIGEVKTRDGPNGNGSGDDDEDEDDVFAFPDDFSTMALASLPDENKDAMPYTCRSENIWIACKVGDEDFVREYLRTSSASPDAFQCLLDGRSPLYFASLCGHETIVRMLLAAGATDPDRTAELSALNQRIRTLLKENRRGCASEAKGKAKTTTQRKASREKSLTAPANSEIGASEMGKSETSPLLPQLSSISASSSKAGSESDQSSGGKCENGKETNQTTDSTSRRFIPKLSKRRLRKTGLFDPGNFSLPDLSTERSNRRSQKSNKAGVGSKKTIEAAIDSRIASHGKEQLSDDSVLAMILSTSFVDCTEVVLPDLFFEAPPVEAYGQSEGALHEPDASETTFAEPSSSQEEVPSLIQVRTYDAKELLPRPPSEDMELPTLKASVCGVTAVLEEDVVEEKRPKVMMSWMESDLRKVPEDEVRSFDSEDYVTLRRSDNSADEDSGLLASVRDLVCHAFDAISGTLKRD
jgi:hypothetical protein